ncbi:MAG: glycoside hydrolase family 127 protein [Treponema sp.]|nr:glycoside hydrolase family 127 protein [Treponema sp.]
MNLFAFKRSEVYLNDQLLLEKRNENRRYLMSLDNDALLLNYRTEAVLDNLFMTGREKLHGGWENPTCQLRGHFLGHWLSGAAMHFASTGDMEIKAKADSIVSGLAFCQKANGGEWAASIPEKYLDRIAHGKRVWAPHYTIHKTFMGLLDMYSLTGNTEALEVAQNWAKWFLNWTAQFSREEMDNILDVETGGMLEIWALLYGITGKKDYLTLMERYYRGRLFEPLLAGKDMLTNMHANTTIPEIMGAAIAYETTGEEKWLKIVEAYWDFAVTLRGQYATGGQTCGEVWTPKMGMSARLGDKNQEHCTVYNMMRVADFLIRVTGDKKFADYWEQNLYNGIFAQGYWHGHFTHGNTSPNPDRGLLTYFLPLRAGGRKAWSSETEDFFCCHGTLVQANASFDRGIYYSLEKSKGLAICQFFNSTLKASIGDDVVELEQRIDTLSGRELFSNSITYNQAINEVTNNIPHDPDILRVLFKITTEKPISFELKIRVPFWTKGEPSLCVNGEKQVIKVAKGWIIVKRNWYRDTVTVEFGRGLSIWPLPDKTDTVAFLYGPIVLAGLCDEEIRLSGDQKKPEEFIVHDNEREWGVWMNTFKTTGQAKNIRMLPLYQVGYEPYTVYFPVG